MKLTLGFSPCPNDTFIFDALVHKKIDTGPLEFEVVLEDVQTLNEWALLGKLQVTKLSYGILGRVLENYVLLNSGGALGKGVGPLLIAREEMDLAAIGEKLVAIPGEHTTAHMLFSRAFPRATRKKFMVFHQVEDAVLNGVADAGVIIHENRFTYQQKGLKKLADLGEYWEKTTGGPIPLGGIVAQRSLGDDLIKTIDGLIRESLEYAFARYPAITGYVKSHAREMSEEVMRKHIDLYVNDYSLDLGADGKAAVKTLLEVSGEPLPTHIFVA